MIVGEAMHMRGQRVYKNSILLVQFLFSFTVNLKLFFLKKNKKLLIKKNCWWAFGTEIPFDTMKVT